jgi:tetratricopeptide (TPR) repeat protein
VKGMAGGGLHIGRKDSLYGPVALGVALSLVALSLTLLGCTDLKSDARELEKQGDLTGAVSAYQKVLEGNPDDLEALEAAGVDLALLGRYDEALALQERLVALDPTEVETRLELGFNYLSHQDRPDDAVRVFGEAARLDPSAKNLAFLAQAQMTSGDLAAAEETLRQAIAVDPKYAAAYIRLVALLEVQGRVEDAALVVEQALLQGITVGDS